MIAGYVAIGIAVGVVIGLLAGRLAKWLGLLCLALGSLPMGFLFLFESQMSGDTSGVGMLATLAAILLVPFGIVVLVVGLLRG